MHTIADYARTCQCACRDAIDYGVKNVTGEVFLTGATICQFDPETGAKGTILITVLEPGAVGTVAGLLASGPRPLMQPFANGTSYVENFGKSIKKAMLVITDGTYSGTNTTPRPYNFGAIVPYIEITGILTRTPIYAGETVVMQFYSTATTLGNYKFLYELRVPEDAWQVPQSKSKYGTLVFVMPPKTTQRASTPTARVCCPPH